MTQPRQTKDQLDKKRKVLLTFLAAAFSATALTSASYAWLSISRTPMVSDLNLNVLADNRMEIAMDENGKPGEWDVVLDLSTVLDDLVPLRTVTYSQNRNSFYAMEYGVDGRPAGATIALSDDTNANVHGVGNASAEAQGYYLAVTFWVRGSSSASIGLSEAKEVEDGLSGTGTYVIGNPVWDGAAVSHTDGGNGLETALRVGFRCQTTDLEGVATGEEHFVMYEPNSDSHADGSSGYETTESIDGGPLVADSQLIRQTTSSWNETTPVLSSSVLYSMGTFEKEPHLFDITTASMQKVTMYLWLEGQDMDCTNAAAAAETSVLANIQFTVLQETGTGSGIIRD